MANKKNNTKKKSDNSSAKKNNTKKVVNSTSKKNNKVIEETAFDASLGKVIRLILIVGFTFGAFYFATWLITRDTTKKEEDNSYNSGFSYTEIMAGRSFSIKDGEYYVIYYDSTDEDLESTYSSLVSKYRGKEGALSIYTVNMGEGLNKSLINENSNTHPNNASELAINGPTLIKYSNHEVVDYYEGEESIKSVLE